ncbi:MAG: hypothetical protein SFT68_05850, partial [Rickettsiaceae bacterium]|nr:hypothetical protein [Rickettsiaceae bacterium]
MNQIIDHILESRILDEGDIEYKNKITKELSNLDDDSFVSWLDKKIIESGNTYQLSCVTAQVPKRFHSASKIELRIALFERLLMIYCFYYRARNWGSPGPNEEVLDSARKHFENIKKSTSLYPPSDVFPSISLFALQCLHAAAGNDVNFYDLGSTNTLEQNSDLKTPGEAALGQGDIEHKGDEPGIRDLNNDSEETVAEHNLDGLATTEATSHPNVWQKLSLSIRASQANTNDKNLNATYAMIKIQIIPQMQDLISEL